jgi:hypothetical protein
LPQFIGGGYADHIRQSPQIADVAEAMMHRTIGTDEAGPVEAEDYRQFLQNHFLPDLIESPLHEG